MNEILAVAWEWRIFGQWVLIDSTGCESRTIFLFFFFFFQKHRELKCICLCTFSNLTLMGDNVVFGCIHKKLQKYLGPKKGKKRDSSLVSCSPSVAGILYPALSTLILDHFFPIWLLKTFLKLLALWHKWLKTLEQYRTEQREGVFPQLSPWVFSHTETTSCIAPSSQRN